MVLSVHNLAYQGIYESRAIFPVWGFRGNSSNSMDSSSMGN